MEIMEVTAASDQDIDDDDEDDGDEEIEMMMMIMIMITMIMLIMMMPYSDTTYMEDGLQVTGKIGTGELLVLTFMRSDSEAGHECIRDGNREDATE